MAELSDRKLKERLQLTHDWILTISEYQNNRTTLAGAGDEQEELHQVQRSGVSNVAYSIWKDSSPTWGKLCKGCKRENHFICRCRSVRKVAEEVVEGDQFCIDAVIQDTKKP